MKKITYYLFVIIIAFNFSFLYSQNFSGKYTIGTSGNYTSIAAATIDLVKGTVTGDVIFEIQNDYNLNEEGIPLSIKQFTSQGGDWTVTIRPAEDVTSLLLSGAITSNTAGLLNFNGADRYILDGRPGGTGSISVWTIRNTATGPTVFFYNQANNNCIKYITIEGLSNYQYQGVITFSGNPDSNSGNNYNTVDNCTIKPYGSNYFVTGIYSKGIKTNPNSNNTISNSNICNFSTSMNGGQGIFIEGYDQAWKIKNNSFYSTYTASSVSSVIKLDVYYANSTANEITGNYLGGSAPKCEGNQWVSPYASGTFKFIDINVGTSGSATVSDNTISNFRITSTGGVRIYCIYIRASLKTLQTATM